MHLLAITPKPINAPIRVVSDSRVSFDDAINEAKKLARELKANVVLEFNNDFLINPKGQVIQLD